MVSIDLTYLSVPIEEMGQEVPPVHMGRQCVRISMSPLWPQQRSKSFKAAETGDGPPQTEGDTEHDFSGRAADGGIEARSGMPVTGSPGPFQAAGVWESPSYTQCTSWCIWASQPTQRS